MIMLVMLTSLMQIPSPQGFTTPPPAPQVVTAYRAVPWFRLRSPIERTTRVIPTTLVVPVAVTTPAPVFASPLPPLPAKASPQASASSTAASSEDLAATLRRIDTRLDRLERAARADEDPWRSTTAPPPPAAPNH